jgi:hypothetical protein
LPSSDQRRLRPDAAWREADGEVIGIDQHLTTYVSTRGAGALLWEQLVDGATPEQLANRLVATYGIEPERAERDVAVFLGELEQHGFLEP